MKRLFLIIILLFFFSDVFSQDQFMGISNAIQIASDSLITFSKRPHAAIGFADSAVTITVSVQGDWYQITNATGNLFNEIDVEFATWLPGDTLRIDEAGHYDIISNSSWTGVAAAVTWSLGVSCNGVHIANTASPRTTSNNSSTGNVSAPSWIDANVGDKITLEIRNDTGTQNPVINKAYLRVIRTIH